MWQVAAVCDHYKTSREHNIQSKTTDHTMMIIHVEWGGHPASPSFTTWNNLVLLFIWSVLTISINKLIFQSNKVLCEHVFNPESIFSCCGWREMVSINTSTLVSRIECINMQKQLVCRRVWQAAVVVVMENIHTHTAALFWRSSPWCYSCLTSPFSFLLIRE